jgi:hypothetical protein
MAAKRDGRRGVGHGLSEMRDEVLRRIALAGMWCVDDCDRNHRQSGRCPSLLFCARR